MTTATLNFPAEALGHVHKILEQPSAVWDMARKVNAVAVERLRTSGPHMLMLEATKTGDPETWLRERLANEKAILAEVGDLPKMLKAEDARLRAVHADATAKARQVRAANLEEITRLEGYLRFLPSQRKAEADKLKQSGLRADQINTLLDKEPKFDPAKEQARIAVLKAENDAITAFLKTSPVYDFTLLAGTTLAEERTE